MAESGQNERASFGKIARSQTRYGTNTKATITNEAFVKHYVKPGETLQGIALKYSSTVSRPNITVDMSTPLMSIDNTL